MNTSKQRSSAKSTSNQAMTASRPMRKCPAEVPDVINADVLAVMSDEELNARERSLEDDRAKVDAAFYDPRYWEEEIAYIRREYEIRYCRRRAHSVYSKAQDSEFYTSEAHLPVADVDNTAFLRFIGELN